MEISETERALAERVRAACVHAALDAYTEGGMAGLCQEGRWELALDAMRALDLARVVTQAENAAVEKSSNAKR
ncbi:acetyltransferase [Anaerolineae bacterium CFX7]|nr:acetyltransferase [Anaerolineae bacterium CFX7]